MSKKEIIDHVLKYVHPFCITKGKGVDPIKRSAVAFCQSVGGDLWS